MLYSYRHPGQPGMFAPPDMPGMRPRMPGQLSPHTQGPQPFGANPQMGVPAGAMPPQKPPTPGKYRAGNCLSEALKENVQVVNKY